MNIASNRTSASAATTLSNHLTYKHLDEFQCMA